VLMLMLVGSVVAGMVPMIAFLVVVWWLDRYDREPIWLVAAVFLWGALFAAGGSYVTNSISHVALAQAFGWSRTAEWITIMFVAPLVEEPLKAAILFIVAATPWFDNTTDGFVYGAAAGLGFAMSENILYFSRAAHQGSFGLWAATILIRTATSGVMHAMATSIVGAALGWAKTRTIEIRVVALLMGFVTAVTIHTTWNGLIVIGQAAGTSIFWVDILIFFVEFAMIFCIFMLCLHGEHRMIHDELMIEAKGGVLPPQHVAIISSVTKRAKSGWCPAGINQQEYIDTATKLAFRRMQCRGRGRRQARYLKEARELRHALRAMLGTNPLSPDDDRTRI
jgi:protease PrsW